MSSYDVIIVGGGIVGAACADRLAGEGRRVCLLEARSFMREASWAAPGILHPVHPMAYPESLHPLLRAGPAEFPPLAEDLARRTGIDIGLEMPGIVVMGDQVEDLAEWCGGTIPHEFVDAQEFLGCPGEKGRAVYLAEVLSLRPARLGRALLEGARGRGAELRDHSPVLAVEPGRVRLKDEVLEAESVVLAAGAWSGGLRPEAPTEPVRGQILLYRGHFPHMAIFSDRTYAAPRPDGLVLFGSTVERVGFEGLPTREAVERLDRRAQELIGVRPDDLLAAWAGFRPGTPSGLPYIGRASGEAGLIYATGHYRTGIILAPLTARIVADLVAGREPQFGPFEPQAR
ncbi:MAG: NAD(P)/FAD-dependent oxidoreductase [Planctomycetota bacterium]|jgi:glycine oxidase